MAIRTKEEQEILGVISSWDGKVNSAGKIIHEWATMKGWWTHPRNFGELMALIHSEVSEALESWRNREPPSFRKNGKPEGWGTELADVVIRVFDIAEEEGLDMETLILQKMIHNATRDYRHGNKRA